MGKVKVRHRGHRCPAVTPAGRVKFFRVSPFRGLHAKVDELYHISCECHKQINLAASQEKSPLFNKKIFDAATRHVFNKGEYNSGMLKDKPVAELIGETNRILVKATDKGMEDNMPPAEMIRKLKEDVFVFSACKTHLELKELSGMLTDENGKVRGWQKFSEMANKTHKIWNQDYLQAEYIFATSSAEMAARWADVEKDGDRYNLQYRTAKDDRVRDSHAKLHGTTLPVSDPFWDSYYPPNGWRCRCTAVQVIKEKYPVDNSAEKIKIADAATQQIDSKGRDRNAMFRYNPGKQQVIFPPNHPIKKVWEQVKKQVDASFYDQPPTLYDNRIEDYKNFKKNNNYKDVEFNNKTAGLKAIHVDHKFDTKNGKYELEAHNILFNKGYKTILESEVGFNKKHVEGRLNDRPYEIKTLLGKSSITIARKIAESVTKKAEICVLYFPGDNFSMEKLREGLSAYKGTMPDLIVIHRNEIVFKKTRRPL